MGVKISQLTVANNALLADLFETVQGGVSKQNTLQHLYELLAPLLAPPGTVVANAGSAVPTGWLLCDGSSVLKATYPTLYAALGDGAIYGQAATTFRLPDLRGEFIRGFDAGKGTDVDRTLGSTQSDALESHRHGVFAVNSNGGLNTGGPWLMFGSNNEATQTGYTGDDETRPRNVAMNYLIKY